MSLVQENPYLEFYSFKGKFLFDFVPAFSLFHIEIIAQVFFHPLFYRRKLHVVSKEMAQVSIGFLW